MGWWIMSSLQLQLRTPAQLQNSSKCTLYLPFFELFHFLPHLHLFVAGLVRTTLPQELWQCLDVANNNCVVPTPPSTLCRNPHNTYHKRQYWHSFVQLE